MEGEQVSIFHEDKQLVKKTTIAGKVGVIWIILCHLGLLWLFGSIIVKEQSFRQVNISLDWLYRALFEEKMLTPLFIFSASLTGIMLRRTTRLGIVCFLFLYHIMVVGLFWL